MFLVPLDLALDISEVAVSEMLSVDRVFLTLARLPTLVYNLRREGDNPLLGLLVGSGCSGVIMGIGWTFVTTWGTMAEWSIQELSESCDSCLFLLSSMSVQ